MHWGAAASPSALFSESACVLKAGSIKNIVAAYAGHVGFRRLWLEDNMEASAADAAHKFVNAEVRLYIVQILSLRQSQLMIMHQ